MTLAAGDELAGSDAFALLELVTELRKEMRDDSRAMEGRLMAALADQSRDFVDFTRVHADDHKAERRTSDDAHGRFDAYIAAHNLDQARKDGALGVLRFLVDLAGRNWKALIAAAGIIAAATGNVHLSIGLDGQP